MSIDVGLAGREISYSEYLTLPEDLNAELLDGRLFMRGHPTFEHDWAVNELADLLRPLVTRPDRVFTGVGWKIDERWGPGPDLAILSPVGQRRHYQGVPRLVVEVLSRSNRENDLDLKMTGYPLGGLPFSWVVDLDVPSVVAHELLHGAFVEVARTTGATPAVLPFQDGELLLAATDLVHQP